MHNIAPIDRKILEGKALIGFNYLFGDLKNLISLLDPDILRSVCMREHVSQFDVHKPEKLLFSEFIKPSADRTTGWRDRSVVIINEFDDIVSRSMVKRSLFMFDLVISAPWIL